MANNTDVDMDDSLNAEYYNLEEKIRAVPIEATKDTLESLTELIVESNELVRKAKATDDVIKDAYVVSALTASVHESTKCINISEGNFDPETFAKAIVNYIRPEGGEDGGDFFNHNWAKLGEKIKTLFRYAPGLTYISAHKNDEPSTQVQKVVERKARQVRQQLEARKEPEKVQTVTKSDEGISGTENICKLLHRCFKDNGKKPVCFFRFVIDPKSFSKTIENIFHLSFLARDGHVQISLDNQKLPVLTPNFKERTNQSQREKVQFLMSISQDQWKEIIKVFNITRAVIP